MTSDDLLIASLIRSLAITTEDVMVHAWRPTSREGTGTDQERTASNSTPKMPVEKVEEHSATGPAIQNRELAPSGAPEPAADGADR